MSVAAGTAQWRTAEAWRRLLRERSIIPLTACSSSSSASTPWSDRASSTATGWEPGRGAVPPAILAACRR